MFSEMTEQWRGAVNQCSPIYGIPALSNNIVSITIIYYFLIFSLLSTSFGCWGGNRLKFNVLRHRFDHSECSYSSKSFESAVSLQPRYPSNYINSLVLRHMESMFFPFSFLFFCFFLFFLHFAVRFQSNQTESRNERIEYLILRIQAYLEIVQAWI